VDVTTTGLGEGSWGRGARGEGNYSLFLAEDGLLIGYLETAVYQAALAAMEKTQVNERWQAEMSEFFPPDGPPDQSFTRIAEVFHLD
jgi:L-rhamnose mutarotase